MEKMKNLSNFRFDEFLKTSTGLPNYPEFRYLPNIYALAQWLQDVRTKLNEPIKINSGFRTESVNTAVKGSRTSAHKQGLAADIVVKSWSKFLNIAKKKSFDQIIIYLNQDKTVRFIHVGIRLDGTERNEIWEKFYGSENVGNRIQ